MRALLLLIVLLVRGGLGVMMRVWVLSSVTGATEGGLSEDWDCVSGKR